MDICEYSKWNISIEHDVSGLVYAVSLKTWTLIKLWEFMYSICLWYMWEAWSCVLWRYTKSVFYSLYINTYIFGSLCFSTWIVQNRVATYVCLCAIHSTMSCITSVKNSRSNIFSHINHNPNWLATCAPLSLPAPTMNRSFYTNMPWTYKQTLAQMFILSSTCHVSTYQQIPRKSPPWLGKITEIPKSSCFTYCSTFRTQSSAEVFFGSYPPTSGRLPWWCKKSCTHPELRKIALQLHQNCQQLLSWIWRVLFVLIIFQ